MKPDGKYEAIFTQAVLQRVVFDIMDTGHFCIDVETTGVNRMTCDLVGLSISSCPKEGYYIPLRHRGRDGTLVEGQLSWGEVQPYIAMICGEEDIQKIFFNAVFDMTVLERFGCPIKGSVYDVMLTEHTFDNGRYYRFNMSVVVQRTLGYEMIPIKSLIGKGKKQITFDYVPISQATEYAAADVDMPLRLFYERKVKDRELARKNELVDFPLTKTAKTIGMNGIQVDLDYMQEMKSKLVADQMNLQDEVNAEAGRKINVLAYAALSRYLFDKLKIIPAPGYKRNRSGNYPTGGDHLNRITAQHSVVDKILKLRAIQHVLNHHLNTILKKAIGSRIHTSINLITATTRLSSSGPNLQNVVSGEVSGRSLRRGFVVPEGWYWYLADYSQVELRILAHLLVVIFKDWRYANLFLEGADIHQATASVMFGVSLEEITLSQRRAAKAINFGIIYGMGPGGLSYALDCSFNEAQGFFRTYLERYPSIRQWMAWQKNFGDKYGYVETPFFGTRRYIKRGQHTIALNSPIQGGAAEVIRKAMNDVQGAIERDGKRTLMLIQVHDELDFQVPDDEQEWFMATVPVLMSEAIPMAVPLVVEVKKGPNWADLKEV